MQLQNISETQSMSEKKEILVTMWIHDQTICYRGKKVHELEVRPT